MRCCPKVSWDTLTSRALTLASSPEGDERVIEDCEGAGCETTRAEEDGVSPLRDGREPAGKDGCARRKASSLSL